MAQLHHIYLKYVMGELEYDAIMVEARRCGVDSVKKFLSMIVTHEIERFRGEYVQTLTNEELENYQERDHAGADLDDDIPF